MQSRHAVPEIAPDEVYARLTDADEAQRPLVVDVREPDEWAEGHIDGAAHIPLGELQARHREIPRDRDVVLVCHLGARSQMATAFLRRVGVDRALNMRGGMDAWQGSHLPVER